MPGSDSSLFCPLEERASCLARSGRFKPKGKSEMMSVYRCPWESFESIIGGIKPDEISGCVVVVPVSNPPAYLTRSRGWALEERFDAVGVTTASPCLEERDRLAHWLREGMHGPLTYLDRAGVDRCDPRTLLPMARSVVVTGLSSSRSA